MDRNPTPEIVEVGSQADRRRRHTRIFPAAVAVGVILGGAVALPALAQEDSTPSSTPSATAEPSPVESAESAESAESEVPSASASGSATAAPEPSSTSSSEAKSTGRSGETELTGTTADRVRAAVLESQPGATIHRLETDADGAAYEAHITKADGTRATVKLDEGFVVTSVEDDKGGRGGHGRRGRHGRGGSGSGETELTGEQAERVRAAVLEAVPGATIKRMETDSGDAAYEAHLTKSDGTRATAFLDESYTVTSVTDDPARTKRGATPTASASPSA